MIKEGVYISNTGKLKYFYVDKEKNKWMVDEGQTVKHKIFRMNIPVEHECGVGFPMFHPFSPLYKCEWISEL